MADSGPEEFYFLGVSTAGSSIVAVFPRWAEILGLDAVLVGRDLPLKSEPGAYDRLVRQIRDRPQARGGLVTSHKVAVYRHAGHLFQELDRWAELCGEVSCISKPDGRLVGQAKDPLTSGRALEDAVGSRYWLEHPEAGVLCLGAGGSGTAITCRLLIEDPPPARILLTNRSPERLEEVRAIHQRLGLSTRLEYHAVRRPEDSDALLARLPPESLVINATGMGKDAPGSPLSDAALFPRRAVVWDFNYLSLIHI